MQIALRRLGLSAVLLLTLWMNLNVPNTQAADEIDGIRKTLARLDPQVVPSAERDSQRSMLGRYLRSGIKEANAASTAEWNTIKSRDDWERFRREKLDRLAKSLSRQPFLPGKPKLMVTGTVQGEGCRIENLILQPDGRTVITANLYLPDPVRESMPGILLAHSHHNPKHEGELQDMGMTWARAGCCVLVPDHLGHGERRQHPFHSAADYAGEFAVGRQDYYFRYDMSLQLYLVGESLMGWMVHDLMSCVDGLLARQGVDSKRIILLGSVAGGGDPAAVTAALDERIAGVVPFNFGGPQPENRYPLPPDADASFNFAGSGSWEATRNLSRSAADGFLPWVIVGSVAPRHLIHAHEFAWDRERDPVWKRYEKIWNFYEVGERLAFAHGHGTLSGQDPPGSHCNNIGAVHRRQIHEAFRKWFDIAVKPEDEYRNRRSREELICLTDEAQQKLQPKPLHEILAAMADAQLRVARAARATVSPKERRKLLRESWARLLGNVEPPREIKVREGSPYIEIVDGIRVTRELLETEPGITVPLMTLSYIKRDGNKSQSPFLTFGVASDGIAKIIERRSDLIAAGLNRDSLIVLADVRGTGESSPGSDRGQQGGATAHSATHLMLGQTILGGQLRDLRAVWRHVRRRTRDPEGLGAFVLGGAGVIPLATDVPFSPPRRIDGRPRECEPTGALLAALLALFEDDVESVLCHRGLVSYRSALDSPFVQIPHECIVPGLLCEADLPDLIAALAPREIELSGLVDGCARRVPIPAAKGANALALQAYADENAATRLQFR